MLIPIIPIISEEQEVELHTCPYRIEICGDYLSLCDCDEEQEYQCAMDI